MEKVSSYTLHINTTVPGKNQATHPSILCLDEDWNGFKFFLAHTPYPYADGTQENPCVLVSKDMIHWVTPEGLHNPIAHLFETNCDELKDPELVFNSDTNELELWYMGRINSSLALNGPLYVFRKTSKDLIHWSEYEIVYVYNEIHLVSPSVLYENGIYRFWGIRSDNDDNGLYYMESADLRNWSQMKRCNIKIPSDISMWHGAISKIEGNYYFVWCGNPFHINAKQNDGQHILYAQSSDGINFMTGVECVENTISWSYLYRPSLGYVDNKLYLFYGVVGHDNRWFICMNAGETIDSLNPVVTEADIFFSPWIPTRKHKIKKMIKKFLRQII